MNNKKDKIAKIIASILAFVLIVLEWIYIFFDIKNSFTNISLIKIISAILYVAVGIGVTFLIIFLSKTIERLIKK